MAVLLPLTIHQQAVTGPLINALLLLTLLWFGRANAFFVALLPSSAALAAGLLPAPLAPLLPFIMISNCLYIAVFAVLTGAGWRQRGQAVLAAALVKASFLWLMLTLVLAGLLPAALNEQARFMMSFAQLWTAVAGGFLALGIYQLMGKYVDWSSFTRRS